MRALIILSVLALANCDSAPALSDKDYAQISEGVVAKDSAGITTDDLPWLRDSCKTLRIRQKELLDAAASTGASVVSPVALAICDKVDNQFKM